MVTDGFTLAKGAPHKNAALAWLKSIGSKEAQESFSDRKGSIPACTDIDPSRFDSYHRWSMADFAKDKLLPSCVHGSAAAAAFQQAFNDALTSFLSDKNIDNFAGKLTQAGRQAGQDTVGKLDLGTRTIELQPLQIPPDAPF